MAKSGTIAYPPRACPTLGVRRCAGRGRYGRTSGGSGDSDGECNAGSPGALDTVERVTVSAGGPA